MTSASSPSSFLFPDNLTSFSSLESAVSPRAILPRPHKILGDAPSSGPGVADRQAKRPRTNVTIACDVCKLARAKCDGKIPCMRCGKRALACSYNHGNDRRQNRGSNEEMAALTERLVQYQKFVCALRSFSAGNAGVTLQQLRSPSNRTLTFMDVVTTPAAGSAALAAAVGLLNETKSEGPACMDMEATSALVGWIKHDLDTALVEGNRTAPSQPKKAFSDQQACNGVEVSGPSTTTLGVERLLC